MDVLGTHRERDRVAGSHRAGESAAGEQMGAQLVARPVEKNRYGYAVGDDRAHDALSDGKAFAAAHVELEPLGADAGPDAGSRSEFGVCRACGWG